MIEQESKYEDCEVFYDPLIAGLSVRRSSWSCALLIGHVVSDPKFVKFLVNAGALNERKINFEDVATARRNHGEPAARFVRINP